MTAYYNENDPQAGAWLRELIKAGAIAPGIVDERSIEDVRPDDLREFTQCHFFAGIGVWSYALRQAGWPDDKPVWTGSCPCQPFSAAGKGNGFADERHLWPAWFHLISQCQPSVIFGEQVGSKDGLTWLDLVQTDLEAAHYALGAVDLPAAGVGAPHIRQRLWFVAERAADASSIGQPRQRRSRPEEKQRATELLETSGVGHTDGKHPRGHPRTGAKAKGGYVRRTIGNSVGTPGADGGPGATNGFWRDADWLYCRDGRWRAVEPSTTPLVDGAPTRVVRLRGYGNAINAEAAKAFIEAYRSVADER